MLKALFLVLVVPIFALADETKVNSSIERTGEVAAKKFLARLKTGKYEGTYGRDKKECVVEVTKDKGYLTVEVDDLSTNISLKLPCSVKESKTSLALIDEEEDGDEAHGSYLFTRTARVTKLKGGSLKVSVVEEKEYLEIDQDKEVETRSCTIKP